MIGPVVPAEKILIEIALGVYVVGQRISSSVFRRISLDILERLSQSFHHVKALYVLMMDMYLIFQFVKGRCHGNQIILPYLKGHCHSNPMHLLLCHSKTELDNAVYMLD